MSVLPDIDTIVAAISQVIGDAPRPLTLHEPIFSGKEKEYVSSCIDEGWVSSVGSFVDRFENDLASTCGAAHAVVVVNGTAALQMALVASGLQPGDEVLIPSLTFVATANSVVHAGGVPHFVDAEENSLGVCPDKLEAYLKEIVTSKDGRAVNNKTGRRIFALMPVHIFGHPCQVDRLAGIAQQYGLTFIEDATEALGSEIAGKKVGGQHTSVFSFNGNKILTTGGGGAVLTNDDALAKKIKHLTTTAKQSHKWAFNHDEVAWNYRMPNLNAALGCAQLEQLPKFLEAKRTLAERYMAAFADVAGVSVLAEPENTKSNYWLTALVAEQADSAWLEQTLTGLHEAGIMCRPIWTPLHLLPMYKDAPRAALHNTQSLAQRIINLPSSVILGIQYA